MTAKAEAAEIRDQVKVAADRLLEACASAVCIRLERPDRGQHREARAATARKVRRA